MSILSDDRRYGTDKEKAEWEQEVKAEYRRQEWLDNLRAEAEEILTGYYGDE